MIDLDRSENLNLSRILAPENSGLVGIRNNQAVSAIVFVHGFWASSLDTWGIEGGRFWPFELGRELETDIYCFQYNSSLAGRSSQNPLTISQLANNLTNDLMSIGPYERIFFVTHSYGGIVIKSLISNLLRGDPLPRQLAQRIFGFCAISCPNRGHWMASVVSMARSWVSESARALRVNNRELHALHDQFLIDAPKLGNLRGMTIGEAGFLFRIFRVHEHAAKLGDFDHVVSEHNHWGICCNLTPARQEFRWIKDFVRERLDAPESRHTKLTLDPGFLGSSGKS